MSAKTGLTAWEVPTGKKLWNDLGSDAPLVAVDPRGQFLITAGGFDGTPKPWTVCSTPRPEAVSPDGAVEPVDLRRARRYR